MANLFDTQTPPQHVVDYLRDAHVARLRFDRRQLLQKLRQIEAELVELGVMKASKTYTQGGGNI